MEINDIIGSIGVTLMLLAYLLNIIDKIDDDDISYILLNLVGGALAFVASYMINYYPFMVLEGAWMLISIWGLFDYFEKIK
jgi:hypothetical protein